MDFLNSCNHYYYELSNTLCHIKCREVNDHLMNSQKEGKNLENYNTVPPLPHKHYVTNFLIEVKDNMPLYLEHNVKFVSVAIPGDASGNQLKFDRLSLYNLPRTIEIVLFDSNEKVYYSHPSIGEMGTVRFWSVDELMIFLDKLVEL